MCDGVDLITNVPSPSEKSMTRRRSGGSLFREVLIASVALLALRGSSALAGAIVAWGADFAGQVSNVPAGTDFTAIAAGGQTAYALRADGSIVAWGADANDLVSNVPTGTGYTALAAGDIHAFALRADGSIVAWGADNFGVISDTPTGTGFTAIAAKSYTGYALRSDGSIVGWGWMEGGGSAQ